jgi:hypothetical protein
VKLESLLPISLLDGARVSPAFETEYFIVIALCHVERYLLNQSEQKHAPKGLNTTASPMVSGSRALCGAC